MAVSDLISSASVLLDVSVKNKRHFIEAMAAEAAVRLERDATEIFDALESREELGSTDIGKGVALPHAELAGASRPLAAFRATVRAAETSTEVIELLRNHSAGNGRPPPLATGRSE